MKRFARQGFALGMTLAFLAVSCPGQTARTGQDLRQTAIVSEQKGDNTAAETAWRALLKVHPADAEAYAHLGLLAAREERYTEAVPLYRKALALNPKLPGVRLDLGLSEFKSGDLKAAIQTFTPLLKSEPAASPEALRLTTLIGLAHYGLGEYAAAVPFMKAATEHDPQNLPFRLVLAHSCLWAKQYQCVLDVYHQILMLNAESAEADMLAGEAYDEMKNDAGATQQFRAAVKADPRLPNVHFGLGYLLWRLMQYDEAAQQFKAELANDPEHAQALTYLADSEIRMNHPEAAPPLLEKAIRIDSSIALAHLDLGIVYDDGGRKVEALRELKTAEKLNPNDVNIHWRLARFYLAEGKKDEAKVEFDKTRNLQKAADETIFIKLKKAQDKGKPAENTGDAAPTN
ncbi:MAG: tetratricopeptide repeat protein [Terracidiphilus sp.]